MIANLQSKLLGLLLGLTVASLGSVLASDAAAQEFVYQSSSPVWYQDTVYYHRVYQGNFWHWTPELNWHRHDRYVDVPYRVPSEYSYTPPAYVPTVIIYYR